jgi:integrase
VGDLGDLIRARRPLRVPVVMTRDEVKAVLAQMSGDRWLMASFMYGAGLRLTECLCLRVQDIDFGRNEITIRAGKGDKDRRTMLPESLKRPLEQHLSAVKRIHDKDLADGWGRVLMPDALDASTPTRPPTGAGNGSFRKCIGGATPRPASRAAITSTKLSSSGRCGTRSLAPD